MRNKLPGTWVFKPKYANGGDETITTKVALDGSYVTTISLPTRKLGPRIIRQVGTWRVEDGFLIEEVTDDSQTNASVPYTSRTRIVRVDDHELELDNQQKSPGIVSPTNQIILRRQSE